MTVGDIADLGRAARVGWILVLLGLAGCGTGGSASLERPAPAGEFVRYETEAHIDPDSGELQARSVLAIPIRTVEPTTIAFLLNDGLDVLGVDGAAVRSYRVRTSDFAPVWNMIELDLDPSAGTEQVTVELRYAGVLNMGGAMGGITPAAIELSIEAMWHPLLATLDREMSGSLRLHLPGGWSVVSTGEARAANGAHMLEMSVPQLDVPFFAAPGLRRWADESATVYSRAAGEDEAAVVLRAATACGEFLDGWFGERDPLPAIRIAIVDRPEVGMSRKNFLVLPRVDPSDRIGLYELLCHELAHYWTGSAGPFTADHWMSESFAEYAAALFLRERFGEAAFRQRVAEWATAGQGQGPVWTPEASGRPSYLTMYRLGPYLLSRLEERIGRADFAAFLRRYMVYDIRRTEELLRQLDELAGADAETWFRAQLAGHHAVIAEDLNPAGGGD